jgi:hypothetical protein
MEPTLSRHFYQTTVSHIRWKPERNLSIERPSPQMNPASRIRIAVAIFHLAVHTCPPRQPQARTSRLFGSWRRN